MSSSLQSVLEQPLRFSTGAFQSTDSTSVGRSAVLLREVSLIDSGSAPQPATLMAVATDHAEGAGSGRAERAIERFQNAIVDGTQTDMAARLKSAFRVANQDIYDSDPGEVSMVAMVARGKYASFAVVGDNQAFLYRAERINQVTRNQRAERTSPRRGEQRTLDTQVSPEFLGTQERLESRLPAIFDITLLPLDSVALLSGLACGSTFLSSNTNALVAPGKHFRTLSSGKCNRRMILGAQLPYLRCYPFARHCRNHPKLFSRRRPTCRMSSSGSCSSPDCCWHSGIS